MTIQEAIRSGRKYKRKTACIFFKYDKNISISYDNLMANDYELEPEVVEFECEWLVEDRNIIPYFKYGSTDLERFRTLTGKKTKVKVVVME